MKFTHHSTRSGFRFAILATALTSLAAASAEEGHRASYYKGGEIHVIVLGTPEGEPEKYKDRWGFVAKQLSKLDN